MQVNPRPLKRRAQEDRSRATTGALLRAAEFLFGRNGYEATGLDEIAARAGVTKGALYHHFPNGKAEIFEAVVLRLHERLMSAMDDATADAVGPEVLRRVLDTYFRIAAETPFHRITSLDAPSVLGPDKWREIEHRHSLRHIRDSVDLVLSATKVSEARKEMLAQALFGAAYEATFAVANAKDRAGARLLAVETLAAIIEGAYAVMLREHQPRRTL